MRVSAPHFEGSPIKPTSHLRATCHNRSALILANLPLGRIDRVEQKGTRADQVEKHECGDFRSRHDVDEEKVVRQDPREGVAVGGEERRKEAVICGKRRGFGHEAVMSPESPVTDIEYSTVW